MRILLILSVLLSVLPATAQTWATLTDAHTEVTITGENSATFRFRRTYRIENEKALSFAHFSYATGRDVTLSSFSGIVTDASGKQIRRIKRNELTETQYNQDLANDTWHTFFAYTPIAYPFTISYEWEIKQKGGLPNYPMFAPQSNYHLAVENAVYQLRTSTRYPCRITPINIQPSDSSSCYSQQSDTTANGDICHTLQLRQLPAIGKLSQDLPFDQQAPMVYLTPCSFNYAGTSCDLTSWQTFGLWVNGLLDKRNQLSAPLIEKIHALTDTCTTQRSRVEVLYRYLRETTRYVSIQLGIGGWQPFPAKYVYEKGIGDCKALSNYMCSMLQEAGVPADYVLISTDDARLLPDVPNMAQLNHVIVRVPLEQDTLWIEATNPRYPLGYVHSDIAGHDAILISERGGEMITLPTYADSLSLQRSNVTLRLSPSGEAAVRLEQRSDYVQYENKLAMLSWESRRRQDYLQEFFLLPRLTADSIDIREEDASLLLTLTGRSASYASKSGQRLFIPVNPIHSNKYRVLSQPDHPIYIENGWCDEDSITIHLPEGATVESMPSSFSIEMPCARFSTQIESHPEAGIIVVRQRMLLRRGTYIAQLLPFWQQFQKKKSDAYHAKIVVRLAP